MKILYFVFLSILVHPIISLKNSYKAAVVEHVPILKGSPSETIVQNLKIYEQFITEAKSQGVDIVVFPEYGLTTLVENPENYAFNLSQNDDDVKAITKLARENRIYLVVNLLEENVQASKKKYYNTNLVIDRSGNVIVKYRKINLFREPNLTPGNESVTFTTDFGVTFRTFICWDILSIQPGNDVIEKGVTDVAYSTSWFNTLPFYGALSTQHGYVLANNVNLLAANCKRPEFGNGGSGIFLSNGELGEVYLSDSPNSKMVIKTVPITAKKNTKRICNRSFAPKTRLPNTSIKNFIIHQDFRPEDYSFRNLDLSKDLSEDVVCNKQICCNFTIGVNNAGKNDVYKLMAFDGITLLDQSEGRVRFCSRLACKNESFESCGTREALTSTNFTKISLSGDFPKNAETFYRPVTSTDSLLPLLGTEFCAGDDESPGISKIQFSTTQSQSEVLVFGIYGRVMNEIA